MIDIEHDEALRAVREYFQYLGLAGPSVAHAEQVIDALDKAGMLACAADHTRAVDLIDATEKELVGIRDAHDSDDPVFLAAANALVMIAAWRGHQP